MKQLLCLLFSVMCWVSPVAAQEPVSPIPMLEQTAHQIMSDLKTHHTELSTHPEVLHAIVSRHLLPVVDVSGMARSVLGRQAWQQATPAERQQFTDEFTRLVIRTYSSPLAEYTDEKVQFLPQRGPLDSHFSRVNSLIIRPNGQRIMLSYSLVAKDNHWKVYDLNVEGVSLLESFRAQFGQALQTDSLQALIAKMHKNNQVQKG
jgi:phospholipid transport system substrate-binding protein